MANSIQKDQKKRNLFAKYEVKRLVLKSIIRENTLSKNIKFHSVNELNKLPKNSSLSKIKNRCVLTGRAKGNYSKFKISRISFRELALKGLLPGVTKSSW
jgi:small subunit ribosomal protein S14